MKSCSKLAKLASLQQKLTANEANSNMKLGRTAYFIYPYIINQLMANLRYPAKTEILSW